MKLVFHAAALADLRNIHEYIAKDNPDIAATVTARIKSSLDRLTTFPQSGRTGTVPGTREIIVPNLPYIVVYEPATERIEIIAIFHTAQNRP